MRNANLNKLIKVALLSALAFILMFFQTPIVVLFPDFLKVDISDLPAIIGAFAFGPLYGIVIEAIKNLLHAITQSSTFYVGEVANFLVGSALVGTAGFIYQMRKDRMGAVFGLAAGVVAMAITGALANYFVIIPAYETLMNFPVEAIIGMAAKVNGAVTSLFTFVLLVIVPFNLLKGTLVAVLTLLIYKRVSPLLKDKSRA